jgi:hypothetical protein
MNLSPMYCLYKVISNPLILPDTDNPGWMHQDKTNNFYQVNQFCLSQLKLSIVTHAEGLPNTT